MFLCRLEEVKVLDSLGAIGGSELRREVQLVRRLLIGTAVATVAALPFLGLLLLVRVGYAPLASVDGDLAAGLNGWARERPDVVAGLELLSHVTSPWTFRLLVVVTAGVLWQYGRRRLATWAVVTMAVGGTLAALMKLIVARARPVFDEPVFVAEGLSFPSGHALNSMLGSAVLLLMVLPVLSRRARHLAWAAALAAVVVTGFDRVALGAHFLTDVLAGWALALALVAGTGTAFGAWRREHPAAQDGVERAQADATDLHVRATLHEVGRLLSRAGAAALAMVGLMIALGLLVTDVLNDLPALQGLTELTRRLAADRTATGDAVSNVFSRLADTSTILATMLVVCVLLRVTLGRWRESAFVVLAVTLQALVFVTTQLVVARARPAVLQLDPAAPTASFPSGHTSAALALYGSLAVVLLWRVHGPRSASGTQRRGWVARALAVLLLLVPVAVAWSRLYRGLHFPLDVAGSYVQASLAIAVSAGLVLIARLPEHLAAVLDHGPQQPVVPQAVAVSATGDRTHR